MFKRICCVFLCVLISISICACGKSENVKNLESLISSIGEVTLESEDLIISAEELYNNLSAEEKETVENYSLLVAARENYDTLTIERVEALIQDIGEVSLDSGEKIETARAEYDALESEHQARVSNADMLIDAEAAYEFVLIFDANTIKDYQTISAKKANLFDETINTWFEDADARATLFLCFQLQGLTDDQIDSDKLHMSEQFVCICRDDNRVDIYAPYGDNEIMGIQYWPDEGTAQIGVVETNMTIEDYLQLMIDGGVIDDYKDIPMSNIAKILNLMG